MRITVLTHVEAEGSRQHDVVVNQVMRALRNGGHTPSLLAVHADIGKLINGIKRRKPEVIFNLMESFGDGVFGAVGSVGLLELLGIPFTGGGAGEFYIQEDKALSKKLLAYEKLLYPDFAIFSQQADLETGGNLRLPLFVKPLRMDASIGIDSKSLVRTVTEMMDRVKFIHSEVNDSALAEEYIEGREFYVGVLGNLELTAFPPVEMDFSGLPAGSPKVLGREAKFEEDTPEYKGTKAVIADVSPEIRARLQNVALTAYRALRVRDYGRIDLRMTEAGEVYVIEVNASCYLEEKGEFATSAKEHGIDYVTLINRIVELALERQPSAQPAAE